MDTMELDFNTNRTVYNSDYDDFYESNPCSIDTFADYESDYGIEQYDEAFINSL